MKARTADLARGKWKGILLQLGIEDRFLTGKHGPCPMCEGVDRFRFDNKDGGGTFICNQCGAGNGFDLLMHVKGWDFRTAAQEVDKLVGRVSEEPAKRGIDPQARRKMLNDLWLGAETIHAGDMAYRYLKGRGLTLPMECPDLRFNDRAPVPNSTATCPALIALVKGADGKPVTMHRTFLGPNGKADMDNPRALMPGEVPAGAAVRLFPRHEGVLGIAEGIETALAAAEKFKVPVWSAINSTMMAKWEPPADVRKVIVFGDSDTKFGGQAAAYALAHKLSRKVGIAAEMLEEVVVEIPPSLGMDWADAA